MVVAVGFARIKSVNKALEPVARVYGRKIDDIIISPLILTKMCHFLNTSSGTKFSSFSSDVYLATSQTLSLEYSFSVCRCLALS